MAKKKKYTSLSSGFKEEVSGMSKDQINEQIVECQKRIREIKKELKEDPRVVETRELLKFLTSSFGEVRKREEDKVSFLMDKLEEYYPQTESEQA
jgi:tRNA(Phe) wybutosine-synthesizing methylase Tyw3